MIDRVCTCHVVSPRVVLGCVSCTYLGARGLEVARPIDFGPACMVQVRWIDVA